MTPRYIRIMDAGPYCGMGYDLFCRLVRPHVTEVPFGSGKAFDRLELDAFLAEYKRRYGRRPQPETETWQQEKFEDSSSVAQSGTSRKRANGHQEGDFEAALARVTSKRRKRSLSGA